MSRWPIRVTRPSSWNDRDHNRRTEGRSSVRVVTATTSGLLSLSVPPRLGRRGIRIPEIEFALSIKWGLFEK